MTRYRLKRDTYAGRDAWSICDECSQRWRRSRTFTRWDGLRVCPLCNDPRDPRMTPPDIYPEGMPFQDARAPQDDVDQLVDGSTLQPVAGGFVVSVGVQSASAAHQQPAVGARSPGPVLSSPAPNASQASTEGARTIRTGKVGGAVQGP